MADFVHQTENVIDVAAGPLPTNWGSVSNIPALSDSEKKLFGWLPVSYANATFDPDIQTRSGPTGVSVGDSVTPGADSVTGTYTVTDRLLADMQADKVLAVNALRDQKRYPGNLATGLGWDVDLRNETDEKNISGKVTLALAYKASSNSDTITFVGADNTARDLTADQMISVGEAVDAHISAVYAQSWVHKVAIAALTTNADVKAYDISEGW